MECAQREPIGSSTSRVTVVTGLTHCGSDLLCHDCVVSGATGLGVSRTTVPVASLPNSRRLPVDDVIAIELPFISPRGPGDAGDLVGERAGGLIVTAPLFEFDDPALQAV